MQREKKSCYKLVSSIIPQAVTGDVNGAEVDTDKFASATLFGQLDDVATGSFKLQESDVSGSGYADVATDFLVTDDVDGDVPGVASDVVTIGYIGAKRYLRVVFTHTGDGDIAAGIILDNPELAPTGANS